MKVNTPQFLIVFFLSVISLSAQPVKKIKVKKVQGQIFSFFQKSNPSDTLLKNENDIFYLLVSDSLKELLSIQVENGQLQKTGNDSLYRLVHMNGMNYESTFIKTLTAPGETDAPSKVRYVFKTSVNGVPQNPGNHIRIRFKVGNIVNPVLEDTFFYKH